MDEVQSYGWDEIEVRRGGDGLGSVPNFIRPILMTVQAHASTIRERQ